MDDSKADDGEDEKNGPPPSDKPVEASPAIRELGDFMQAITPAIKEVGDKIVLAAKEQRESMMYVADRQLDMHKATLAAEESKHNRETSTEEKIEMEKVKGIWLHGLIRNAVVAVASLSLLGIGFYCIYTEKLERGYSILIIGITLITTMWDKHGRKPE